MFASAPLLHTLPLHTWELHLTLPSPPSTSLSLGHPSSSLPPDGPQMANMLEGGGKTPILTPIQLQDLGFKVVAYPLSLLGEVGASSGGQCQMTPPPATITHTPARMIVPDDHNEEYTHCGGCSLSTIHFAPPLHPSPHFIVCFKKKLCTRPPFPPPPNTQASPSAPWSVPSKA